MEDVYQNNDNELLYLYHQGDDEAFTLLVKKYQKIMKAYARGYYNRVKTSCEINDLYQVAVIALYNAANSYKENMGCRFGSYFRLVMERSVYNHIRHVYSDISRANREAISIDQMVSDHEGIYVVDTIASVTHDSNPKWSTYVNIMLEEVENVIQGLSEKEQRIYYLWQRGFSYHEIAILCLESDKRIDNILYKIKRLLRDAVEY